MTQLTPTLQSFVAAEFSCGGKLHIVPQNSPCFTRCCGKYLDISNPPVMRIPTALSETIILAKNFLYKVKMLTPNVKWSLTVSLCCTEAQILGRAKSRLYKLYRVRGTLQRIKRSALVQSSARCTPLTALGVSYD